MWRKSKIYSLPKRVGWVLVCLAGAAWSAAGCAPGQTTDASVRACERGHGSACYRLGQRLEKERGQKAPWGQVRADYNKACDLGHGPACVRLGEMWATGTGGPQPALGGQKRRESLPPLTGRGFRGGRR